ncbi:MAG TPA: D-aminoacyl-tRNA deacylase [Vicinamibacterales bacterium]|nr:D-aminoacyl-tRNA deacylase [Vicinamibacterales bacterium]
MRAVVQRASSASVTVGGQVMARIGPGLVVLLGVAAGDGPADVAYMTSKIHSLRIFADAEGRMNLSVADAGGAVIVVSQFTLLADVRRGRRPSFAGAADPVVARELYDAVVSGLRALGPHVETGVFQAHMDVALVNDGPVTIVLDSRSPGTDA